MNSKIFTKLLNLEICGSCLIANFYVMHSIKFITSFIFLF